MSGGARSYNRISVFCHSPLERRRRRWRDGAAPPPQPRGARHAQGHGAHGQGVGHRKEQRPNRAGGARGPDQAAGTAVSSLPRRRAHDCGQACQSPTRDQKVQRRGPRRLGGVLHAGVQAQRGAAPVAHRPSGLLGPAAEHGRKSVQPGRALPGGDGRAATHRGRARSGLPGVPAEDPGGERHPNGTGAAAAGRPRRRGGASLAHPHAHLPSAAAATVPAVPTVRTAVPTTAGVPTAVRKSATGVSFWILRTRFQTHKRAA